MATPTATGFFFTPFQFRQAKSLSSDKPSISLLAPLGISPLSLFAISKKQARLGVSSRCSVDPNTLLEEAEAEEGATEKRRELNATNLPWDMPAPHVEELFDQCGAAKDVEVPSPARPFLSLFLGFSPSLLDKLLTLIDWVGQKIKVALGWSTTVHFVVLKAQLLAHKRCLGEFWKRTAYDLRNSLLCAIKKPWLVHDF